MRALRKNRELKNMLLPFLIGYTLGKTGILEDKRFIETIIEFMNKELKKEDKENEKEKILK